SYGGQLMRLVRSAVWIVPVSLLSVFALTVLFHNTPAASAQTGTPPSSSISSSSGPVSWDFAAVGGGTVTNVGIQDICPPGMCDDHDLTLILPAPAATFYQTMTAKLTITYTWTSTVPTDLDVFAISPSGADHGPGSPDDTSTGPGIEILTVTDPVDGVWHIRSVAALAPLPASAHAVVTLTTAARPTAPPPPPPAPGAPTFVNYAAPEDCTAPNTPPGCIQPALGSTTASTHGAGEPSIGVNWNTGKAFIEAGNHTLRVTFNDSVTPATAFWEDQRSPLARVSLDPILFTDDGHFGGTNRTFSSQLNGVTSELSFTDDDGNSWLPTQGSGQPAGVDHQSVGGGPYAVPAPSVNTYPHAIYYCSQDIVTAFCSRSDDGGLTFGPGLPIYIFTTVSGVNRPVAPGTCGGLHGHVRVSPDGTAYVPNEKCMDANGVSRPGVAVSADNGLTWVVRTVPDAQSISPGSDPSIAAGANNTIYLGYVNVDGHAKIAVSQDRGLHWSKSKDAGTPFGTQNAEFAEVIAGDNNRAAFAYLGTPTAGDTQSADFLGIWHLYIAFTYNTGRTWTTVDATPSDPVQRGCIWNSGGSNPCRNLLDFNDITVDKFGRVLVGYADGCTGSCVNDVSQNATTGPATAQDALATIARQVGGRGLFAALDGTQFATRTGNIVGGGNLCYGDPASGISGGPDCNTH
ncbi:MAG TPA: sialidase family protein, partial [Steroidobacteraceae bacterium]|nr:sialidase family protein [Steroidobacteraceae bacterium]